MIQRPRATYSPPAWRQIDRWTCLGLMLYMVLIGSYFVGRYGGLWAENDSAEFTRFLRTISAQARLVPTDGSAYPNGYAAQAIGVFILSTTGVDIPTLQQRLYPLLAALVVLPAWLTYRELTGSTRGATLATALLFTQPEFLFVILRSSHEKFTRTLMLLCIFWLIHSFRVRDRLRLFAMHVVLFYLTAFALISSNNLLAHSFLFAVMLALLFAWLIERRNSQSRPHERALIQRLAYVSMISLGLVYVVMFFIYPPAQLDLRVLQTTGQRIAALFLDIHQPSISAYAQVVAGLVSLPVYFVVSIANWLLLAASFTIWGYQTWQWMIKRQSPATQPARLTYLLYTAFMIQGVVSIAADASGALGSNLQHRLFPSVSILAVALAGAALASWRPARLALPIRVGLTCGVFCIAILSILKATNEPLLSSKWTFYRSNELAALDWADAHMTNDSVWTEFDERLSMGFLTSRGESPHQNTFRGFTVEANTRNLLISDVTRLRSNRLERRLPIPSDALLVYDNGEAQLYHLRPLTPYQR